MLVILQNEALYYLVKPFKLRTFSTVRTVKLTRRERSHSIVLFVSSPNSQRVRREETSSQFTHFWSCSKESVFLGAIPCKYFAYRSDRRMKRERRGMRIEKAGSVLYVFAPSVCTVSSSPPSLAYSNRSSMVWLPRLNVVTVGK